MIAVVCAVPTGPRRESQARGPPADPTGYRTSAALPGQVFSIDGSPTITRMAARVPGSAATKKIFGRLRVSYFISEPGATKQEQRITEYSSRRQRHRPTAASKSRQGGFSRVTLRRTTHANHGIMPADRFFQRHAQPCWWSRSWRPWSPVRCLLWCAPPSITPTTTRSTVLLPPSRKLLPEYRWRSTPPVTHVATRHTPREI